MIFYFFILVLLLLFSKGKYNKAKSFLPHFVLLLLIGFKGKVGCDYLGYYYRYLGFHPFEALMKTTGEYSWYLIEYFTYIFNLDYQTYTIITAVIGISFLFLAQKRIRYIGFLVIIYQMIIVQLGLSGMRQFIAVCILTYTISIYLFDNQKSALKFLLLTAFAATFHISALTILFVLPFVFKLKRNQIFLIIVFCLIGLSSNVLSAASDKYDTRYLQGIRVSAGAWYRFSITCLILFFAMKEASKKMYYLCLFIIVFGVFIGIINSIGLHRFNYYFLPIATLLLIKNYKEGNVSRIRMRMVYALSVFYFLFWFTFSRYTECFIPYNTFLNLF